jgi:hypothetical protein
VSVDIRGCTTTANREFIVTSLKKDEFAITVFPNPAIDEFEIEIPEGFKCLVVKVINNLAVVMGYVGVHHENGKITGTFEMKNFPSGAYVVQVVSNNEIVEIKLIKQ